MKYLKLFEEWHKVVQASSSGRTRWVDTIHDGYSILSYSDPGFYTYNKKKVHEFEKIVDDYFFKSGTQLDIHLEQFISFLEDNDIFQDYINIYKLTHSTQYGDTYGIDIKIPVTKDNIRKIYKFIKPQQKTQ